MTAIQQLSLYFHYLSRVNKLRADIDNNLDAYFICKRQMLYYRKLVFGYTNSLPPKRKLK